MGGLEPEKRALELLEKEEWFSRERYPQKGLGAFRGEK